ncbi:hypothetical protein Kpol_1018p96 [Vanderwaltozyma polyspora DSM 70294]|uniref:A1 cistron-splicing factor AAR2 n=1 Tax=Vanderwaltozyma polyspora (strain ATCC 22028 / DSM 70294 / BCRC 21397 / CBS 2163 / NBRC 10782 / NRRL Y-8283 / UCD 57-17) TaxID=436907 RepID=A7TDU3_VANPO|nr:uncharacterized protein Kpol_1018p96 [Vanderwaltozyma polyspora DSM 70294]EDO19563.1 hypothetical protein Kpol_1018p96 [Vanderwaltozyma polyspora DSM 70294]
MYLFIRSSINVTVGIDQYSFTVNENAQFYGIKNIPKGIHLIYFQQEKSNTFRYGYWFNSESINPTESLLLQYDSKDEIFEIIENFDVNEQLKFQHLMVNYPSVSDVTEIDWFVLSEYLNWDQIIKYFNKSTSSSSRLLYVDSTLNTNEEKKLLTERLKLDLGKSSDDDYLNYTPIEFKSNIAIRPSHEMEDFLDKSYYLNKIILPSYYNNNIYRLFCELQFSFLNSMIFANYGSNMQWHSLIELLLNSSETSDKDIILKKLDKMLSEQISSLPMEYIDYTINGETWDKFLNKSLNGEKLTSTKSSLLQRLPELTAICELGDEIEELESIEGPPPVFYPNIDSEDETDQWEPTVISGVYHNTR